MPVEEHEVHHLVRHAADKPYGCNSDKPRSKGYWLLVREYKKDGTYIMRDKFIERRMSTDCRNYYLWYSDIKCRGCKRPKDREYMQRMTALE